jgi:hypothetical protein
VVGELMRADVSPNKDGAAKIPDTEAECPMENCIHGRNSVAGMATHLMLAHNIAEAGAYKLAEKAFQPVVHDSPSNVKVASRKLESEFLPKQVMEVKRKKYMCDFPGCPNPGPYLTKQALGGHVQSHRRKDKTNPSETTTTVAEPQSADYRGQYIEVLLDKIREPECPPDIMDRLERLLEA